MARITDARFAAAGLAIMAVAASLPMSSARAATGTAPVAMEMPLGGGKYVTFYRYKDRSFEKKKIEGLRTVSLAGKNVCFEGKFGEIGRRDSFALMGSKREFVFRDRKLVARIMRGDNVWVAGEAKKYRSKSECYLNVLFVVKLKDDGALFEERFEKFRRAKNWRRLWDLGDWIEDMGKISPSGNLQTFDRYRQLARRAYRQSLIGQAEQLAANDAEGYFRIAVKLLEIKESQREAIRYLRKSVGIDPDHAKAGERLSGFGFIRYKDLWMTKTEKDRFVVQEKKEAERRRQAAAEAKAREDARLAMLRRNRDALLHDNLELVRLGTEAGLTSVAKLLGEIEDEPLARGLLFEIANSTEPAAVRAFLRAQESPGEGVRMDAADALAWRGDSAALIGSMVGAEGNSAKVRLHAVDALVSMGDASAVNALMGASEVKDKEVREKVFSALTGLTGEAHPDGERWLLWWKANKDGFVPKSGN